MSKKIFVFLITISLIVFGYLIFNFRKTEKIEAQTWLSGWSYRKSHEIVGTTAGAQTNYQMRIITHKETGIDDGENVYLGVNVRDDFGDVRFTNSDEITLLDHWMESFVSGVSATFWVEIPNIPASPNTTKIYIYYGKSDATTTSDALATGIWQVREVELYASYNAGAQFSQQDSIVRIYALQEKAGGGHLFIEIPREWLNGKYIRWRWTGATNRPTAVTYPAVRIYDGSYLRFSSSDFPIGDNMVSKRAGILQTLFADNVTNFGPETRDILIDTSSGTADMCTLFFSVYDFNYSYWYYIDVDWVEINTGSGGSGNLLTEDFNNQINMEVTGTENDYGLYRKYVDPGPSHGSWGSEKPAPPPLPLADVSGWAWSENIGWISFNSSNCDLDSNGYIDVACGGDNSTTPIIDYGVNINETTGSFSGWAWSEHIGWINFAHSGPYPGLPSFSAKLDLGGGECEGYANVCGWARALSYGDGWDGWIKLKGTATDGSSYGVWIETGVTPKPFHGWAWGSDTVGWISFNCVEGGYDEGTGTTYSVCGTSDYKVTTSLSINFPPTASDLSWSVKWCNVLPGVGQVSFQWLYEDPENLAQSNYHLQIATDSGFSSLVLDCEIPQSVISGAYGSSAVKVVSSPSNVCNDGGSLGDRSLEISYRGLGNLYYWRIKVKDGIKWSSDPGVEGVPFDTPSHAYPWVDFNRCPLSPTVDEITQFCSKTETGICDAANCLPPSEVPPPPIRYDTTCYDIWGAKVPCSTWEWDFDGDSVIDSGESNPAHSYSTSGDNKVKLTVYDVGGLFCPHTETTTVTLPIPEWREIPPF